MNKVLTFKWVLFDVLKLAPLFIFECTIGLWYLANAKSYLFSGGCEIGQENTLSSLQKGMLENLQSETSKPIKQIEPIIVDSNELNS